MANAKNHKRKDREIRLTSNFAHEVVNLLNHFSGQLSDGYWENSRGDFGAYGDGYYEDIWNCFDFELSKGCFIIKLKGEPTWAEAAKDCKRFHDMSNKEITDYIRAALLESIDDAREAFSNYTDYELETLAHCIENWKIVPEHLPTRKQILKVVCKNRLKGVL